jgi:hypothetical protein
MPGFKTHAHTSRLAVSQGQQASSAEDLGPALLERRLAAGGDRFLRVAL